MLKGTALVAGASPVVAGAVQRGAAAKSTTIQLAFCSRLLCVPSYEVTRDGEYFRNEGLDVQLVYTRGSTAAMQALVDGAVDYAATSFDDVLLAVDPGAEIMRYTRPPGRAVGFGNRAKPRCRDQQLQGPRRADCRCPSRAAAAEAMVLLLMKKHGADGKKVQFAVLGPNIYEPLRLGQVDAAWVGTGNRTEDLSDRGRSSRSV